MAESDPDRVRDSDDPDADDVEPPADRVDEQELDSFPASDPHSDWSGPAS
jgi:hypothetical protein